MELEEGDELDELVVSSQVQEEEPDAGAACHPRSSDVYLAPICGYVTYVEVKRRKSRRRKSRRSWMTWRRRKRLRRAYELGWHSGGRG